MPVLATPVLYLLVSVAHPGYSLGSMPPMPLSSCEQLVQRIAQRSPNSPYQCIEAPNFNPNPPTAHVPLPAPKIDSFDALDEWLHNQP